MRPLLRRLPRPPDAADGWPTLLTHGARCGRVRKAARRAVECADDRSSDLCGVRMHIRGGRGKGITRHIEGVGEATGGPLTGASQPTCAARHPPMMSKAADACLLRGPVGKGWRAQLPVRPDTGRSLPCPYGGSHPRHTTCHAWASCKHAARASAFPQRALWEFAGPALVEKALRSLTNAVIPPQSSRIQYSSAGLCVSSAGPEGVCTSRAPTNSGLARAARAARCHG
jgi:hypothetical protein